MKLINWEDPKILQKLNILFNGDQYPDPSLIHSLKVSWESLPFENRVMVFIRYNYPALTYVHNFKYTSIDIYPRSTEERVKYNEIIIDWLKSTLPGYYDSKYMVEVFNREYDGALDKEFYYKNKLSELQEIIDTAFDNNMPFDQRTFLMSVRRTLFGQPIYLDQEFNKQTEDLEIILHGQARAEFYFYLKNFDHENYKGKKSFKPIAIRKDGLREVVNLLVSAATSKANKPALLKTSIMNLLRVMEEVFVDHEGQPVKSNTLQKYKLREK